MTLPYLNMKSPQKLSKTMGLNTHKSCNRIVKSERVTEMDREGGRQKMRGREKKERDWNRRRERMRESERERERERERE